LLEQKIGVSSNRETILLLGSTVALSAGLPDDTGRREQLVIRAIYGDQPPIAVAVDSLGNADFLMSSTAMRALDFDLGLVGFAE
jgi:hypothetical protein